VAPTWLPPLLAVLPVLVARLLDHATMMTRCSATQAFRRHGLVRPGDPRPSAWRIRRGVDARDERGYDAVKAAGTTRGRGSPV